MSSEIDMSADTTVAITSEATSPSPRSIVVLGAGVIGLTVAHVLSSRADSANLNVIVVARELPGEHLFSQSWSSPWAGANWSPLGTFDERKHKWEKATFEKLRSLIPSGLVMARAPVPPVLHEHGRLQCDPWWKDIVRDFRVLPVSELPEGFNAGLAFTTVSLKPAQYLNWLADELKTRGVVFIHRNVGSIEEVASLGGRDCVVVNATGLGSKSILGIEDDKVYPIRGQTILVDAPHVKEFLAVASTQNKTLSSETTYIIPRPDGTCILGGTYQADDYNPSIDHGIARGILERCSVLEPGLHSLSGTKIQSLNVGFRPARRGGPKVELEHVQLPLKNDLVPHCGDGQREERQLKVVHAYGLGPAGYQSSWGVAEDVANILAGI